MLLLGRKIYFKNLKQSDVLIFDESKNHYIADYILKDIPYSLYKFNDDEYFFNFKIFSLFIKSLLRFNWNFHLKRKRKIIAFVRELFYHYHLSCIQSVNPKIIITRIDNSFFIIGYVKD